MTSVTQASSPSYTTLTKTYHNFSLLPSDRRRWESSRVASQRCNTALFRFDVQVFVGHRIQHRGTGHTGRVGRLRLNRSLYRWNANRSTSSLAALVVATAVGISSASILTYGGIGQSGTFAVLARRSTDGNERCTVAVIALQIHSTLGTIWATHRTARFLARTSLAIVRRIVRSSHSIRTMDLTTLLVVALAWIHSVVN